MRKPDPARFDRKRDEILRGAERCFLKVGLTAGSTAAICTEAGISAGHLYHYFESKDAIILALAQRSLAEKTTLVEETLARGSCAMAALNALIDANVDLAMRQVPTLLFDVLAEAPRRPEVARALREHSAQLHRLIGHVIAEGQRSGELNRDVDSAVHSGIFLGLLDGLKALAVRGLCARAAADELKRIVQLTLLNKPEDQPLCTPAHDRPSAPVS